MLYKDKIKNLSAVYPDLARVWIDESKLHRLQNDRCTANSESETAELAEDHLVLAA